MDGGGTGELVEWDDEYEGAVTGDGKICVADVVRNEGVDVGVEVNENPDVDGGWVERDEDGDEMAGDVVIPEAADRDVSEAEMSVLELEVDEGGKLIPALDLVSMVGPAVSEGTDILRTERESAVHNNANGAYHLGLEKIRSPSPFA